jgi:hypothetical protein
MQWSEASRETSASWFLHALSALAPIDTVLRTQRGRKGEGIVIEQTEDNGGEGACLNFSL